MKFVYTEGPYREFRGHVFALGKPVTIQDRATEEALINNPSFRRIDDEKEQRPLPAVAQEEVTEVMHRPILHVPAKRGWPLGRPRK